MTAKGMHHTLVTGSSRGNRPCERLAASDGAVVVSYLKGKAG
jgi:hypothetical protein